MSDSSSAPLRLLSVPGEWGTLSIDPRCATLEAWLRIAAAPYELEHVQQAQPSWSANELPVLRSHTRALGPHELYDHLREAGIDADANLSPVQRADAAAWASLVEERLGVAILFAFWAEDENYETVLRSAYAARLAIPLCFYVPWTMRKRVLSQLARRGALANGAAYRIGADALEALNTRLAGRTAFFDSGPSGVDACAFAHLDLLLRCPLPRDSLRAKLRSYPDLVAYVEAFSRRYFDNFEPIVPTPQTDHRLRPPALTGRPAGFPYAWDEAAASSTDAGAQPCASSSRTPKQQRFKRRSRNAVFGALGAALMYAFATDMVHKEEDYEDYDADDE